MVNRALRLLARARGHRLVLVYHRLSERTIDGWEIVPSVPRDLFRAHVQALGEVVDLVPVSEILAKDGRTGASASCRGRPAVALTFDDDLPSHVAEALPILRRLNVPAAFFLSGRALHGLGPYWFQQLEMLLLKHGEAQTATLLRARGSKVAALVLACERHADMRERVLMLAEANPLKADILQRDGIAALTTAGMTIGFHTVDHTILTSKDDAYLDDALSRGRGLLAATVGGPVRYFAYPHGKADALAAAAVHRACFDAAFTGQPAPVRNDDDRYRLGRWEPGPLGVDDLLVKLALRLHRAARPGKVLP